MQAILWEREREKRSLIHNPSPHTLVHGSERVLFLSVKWTVFIDCNVGSLSCTMSKESKASLCAY